MVGRKEFLRAANPVALRGEVSGSLGARSEEGSTRDLKQNPEVPPLLRSAGGLNGRGNAAFHYLRRIKAV